MIYVWIVLVALTLVFDVLLYFRLRTWRKQIERDW